MILSQLSGEMCYKNGTSYHNGRHYIVLFLLLLNRMCSKSFISSLIEIFVLINHMVYWLYTIIRLSRKLHIVYHYKVASKITHCK